MIEKCNCKSVFKCSFTIVPGLLFAILRRSRYVERVSFDIYYHRLTKKFYEFNVFEIGDCEVVSYD